MSILALAGLAALVAAVVEVLIVTGLLPVQYRALALAVGSILVFAARTLGDYFGWDMTMIDQMAEMLAQLIMMLLGTWFANMAGRSLAREFGK